MKISPRMGIFLLLCVAQLAVPLTMIQRHEEVLQKGAQVKLRCQPVDPADPFRGRYVSLNFEMGEARMPRGVAVQEGATTAWVDLEVDEEGFARWGEVHYQKPASGLYVQTEASPYWSPDGETVWVTLPIDRFYMNEQLAPEAERLYFEQVREAPEHAYVLARVLDGAIVLEQLYLNDMPVGEYVRQQWNAPAQEPTAVPEFETIDEEGTLEGAVNMDSGAT